MGESIRHEKEFWRVARRGYLNARDLLIRHVHTCHPESWRTPARALTLLYLQRTPSPTNPEKNLHGPESQIILFDETVPQRTLIPYGYRPSRNSLLSILNSQEMLARLIRRTSE